MGPIFIALWLKEQVQAWVNQDGYAFPALKNKKQSTTNAANCEKMTFPIYTSHSQWQLLLHTLECIQAWIESHIAIYVSC